MCFQTFILLFFSLQDAIVAELQQKYRSKDKRHKEASDGAIENIISGKLSVAHVWHIYLHIQIPPNLYLTIQVLHDIVAL